MHLRLDELSARADLGEAVLHTLATALLVADSTGRITFANRAAEALFRAGDVTIRNHALQCRQPADTAALHKIMHAAANAPQPGKANANTHILQQSDGKGPLVAVALLLPWQHSAATLNRRAHVAVFLLDPTAEIDIPATLLHQLGCTPAEIRLAQALIKGESPAGFAEHHALSRETVRTQLAQLFRKTDTSRQAALLAFLNRCVSGRIFR